MEIDKNSIPDMTPKSSKLSSSLLSVGRRAALIAAMLGGACDEPINDNDETFDDTAATDSDQYAEGEWDEPEIEDTDLDLPECELVWGTFPELSVPMPDLSSLSFELNTPFADWPFPEDMGGSDFVAHSFLVVRLIAGEAPYIVGKNFGSTNGLQLNPLLDPYTLEHVGFLSDYIPEISDLHSSSIIFVGDLDGDGVDELFDSEGYWKWSVSPGQSGWSRKEHQGMQVTPNCNVRPSTLWPIDWNLDGRTDFLTLHGIGMYPCKDTHGTMSVLIQNSAGIFTVQTGGFTDTVNPPEGRFLQGSNLQTYQPIAGGERYIFPTAGAYVGGLAHETIDANGWQNAGVWRQSGLSPMGFEAIDPLEPNAAIQTDFDMVALGLDLGLDLRGLDEDAAAQILFGTIFPDGMPEGITQGELEEVANAKLAELGLGTCLTDYNYTGENMTIMSSTIMGSATGDLNLDGWDDIYLTTTHERLGTVFGFHPSDPLVLQDYTNEITIRYNCDKWLPTDDGIYCGPVYEPYADHYGWASMIIPLYDGTPFVLTMNGWDNGDYTESQEVTSFGPKQPDEIDIHVMTDSYLPGALMPMYKRATDILLPGQPLGSYFAGCVFDIDKDGDLDILGGVEYDKPRGEYRDGAEEGPAIVRNFTDNSRSFVVELDRVSGEHRVEVEFTDTMGTPDESDDTRFTRSQMAYHYSSPETIGCHQQNQFTWKVTQRPIAIRIRDRNGSVRVTETRPERMAPGQTHRMVLPR